MNLYALPAFQDNYIWVLVDANRQCIVVDPGDAAPVERFIESNQLTLGAILITHHHPDHTGGIHQLISRWPVKVYGPANEHISGVSDPLKGGETISINTPNIRFRVMDVPGHTLGHIAYYSGEQQPPLLFNGDTLFSAGCGRLFEGTPAQMDASLTALCELPDNTQICCTHEYTLANLQFGLAVLPDDPALNERMSHVLALRNAGKPSLPTDFKTEKASNPFLRVDEPSMQKALEAEIGQPLTEHVERFAALRAWKDRF